MGALVTIAAPAAPRELRVTAAQVFLAYDLELPWEWTPVACDGEVSNFKRLHLDAVARAVAYGEPAEYKPNCNLVVIDFLLRHGYLRTDEPGYLPLLASLRQGDCS